MRPPTAASTDLLPQEEKKPKEIEGFLDVYVIRPLGHMFVLFFKNTRITPNQVSIASVLAALISAGAFFFQTPQAALLGFFFLLLHSGLDAADGQLARVTGRGSPNGRWIDGICDNFSFASLYLGIFFSYFYFVHTYWPFVLGLMILAGISHSLQSSLTEYVRQLFAYYCIDSRKAYLDEAEVLDHIFSNSHAKPSFSKHIFHFLARSYSQQQRLFLKSSWKLYQRFKKESEDPVLKESFTLKYRQLNQSILKYWAYLFSNSHKVAIVLTAWIAILFPHTWVGKLGMVWYYIYDLALNVLMIKLIFSQNRINQKLEDEFFPHEKSLHAHERRPLQDL